MPIAHLKADSCFAFGRQSAPNGIGELEDFYDGVSHSFRHRVCLLVFLVTSFLFISNGRQSIGYGLDGMANFTFLCSCEVNNGIVHAGRYIL